MDSVSEGFYYHLNEAHNGYLETYLDGGLIGLFLLIILLFTSLSRLSKRVPNGTSLDTIRLIFVIVNVVYNITESPF